MANEVQIALEYLNERQKTEYDDPEDVIVVNKRAEDYVKECRESFDIVTS